MNQVALTLSVIAGVLLLIGVAAALAAVYRTTAQDKTIERQRAEIGDYVRRLDFVEPRLHTLEQQNETLLQLHDPSNQLAKASAEHGQIIALLTAQSAVLHDLDEYLQSHRRPEGSD